MESYSISCTTCRARLRVRDREAIGQILACPKCGSMVLVQPPPGEQPPGTPASESDAARGKPSVAATLPSAAPQSADPATRPARATRFREDFSDVATPPRTDGENATGVTIARPPKAGGTAVAAPPPSAESLSPQEGMDASPSWHRLAWLAGAAAAGILLALLVVGWLAGRRTADSPSDDTPAEPVVAATPAEKEPPPSDVPTAPATSAHDQVTAAPPADASPTVDSGAKVAHDVSPIADVETPLAPLVDATPPDPATSDQDSDVTPPGAEPDAPPVADAGAVSATPAATPELDIPLAAIDLQDMPLADFANFVADFAGLPVSLDLPAMAVAQIAPDTPLDCQREQLTMDALLQVVLAAVEMKHVVRDGHIVFTPVAVPETPWEATYDVADLVGSEQDVQALGELITALVAPASWATPGGTATLTATATALQVQQDAQAHFQIAQLLDRLRVARGLAPRGGSADLSLDPTPALAEAMRALSAPVSVDFSSPTAVARVLESLRGQTDLHLVVDWRATATASWRPTTDTSLSCADRPLAEVLDAWLGPHNLGFRVCDAHTVQITTREAMDQRPEVAVYPLELAAGEDATEVLAQVRASLQAAGVRAETVDRAIRLDVASRSLLVSLPPPQQRMLAAQLAATGQLRTTGPAATDDPS